MILPVISEVGFYNSQVINKNDGVSNKRKTLMFELELPTEAGGVSYVDTDARQISSNMMICVKPGQTRCTKFPFKCYYVHIELQDGELYDILMNAPTFFETDKADVYKEIFLNLVRHYNSFEDNGEIILQSLVLELIYNISKDVSLKTKNGSLSDNLLMIEKSVDYINKHLTEDLSLESVAKQMSFSHIYFHNTFKAAMGMTLREYVEEQRIKKAIELLLTTSYSLTRIAYECGFSSQSYFSYVFKRRMKVTPRVYVREMNGRYEI